MYEHLGMGYQAYKSGRLNAITFYQAYQLFHGTNVESTVTLQGNKVGRK